MAVETCGSFGPETKAFFREPGHCLRSVTSDEHSYQHLIHKISVAVQRVVTASLMGSLPFVFQSGRLKR